MGLKWNVITFGEYTEYCSIICVFYVPRSKEILQFKSIVNLWVTFQYKKSFWFDFTYFKFLFRIHFNMPKTRLRNQNKYLIQINMYDLQYVLVVNHSWQKSKISKEIPPTTVINIQYTDFPLHEHVEPF